MKTSLIFFIIGCMGHISYAQTTITVNAQNTFQTIDGWEALSNALEAPSVRDTLLPHLDTLISIAVNDVGITRLRCDIKSGVEDTVDYFTKLIEGEIDYDEYKLHRYSKLNDNGDPFSRNLNGFQYAGLKDNMDILVLPFKEKVEKLKDRFYLNLCFVDFVNQSPFHHTSDPEEYAEFMTSAWLFLDSVYGFTPDGLELILEPDNADIWQKKHIAPALQATGNRLSALGYYPEYIAPSLLSLLAIPDYINEIALNPVAMDYLDVISYHRYSGNSDLVAQQKIVDLANLYGKKTAMLEYDYNGDVNVLHYDLKYNNVTAWTKYALLYKSNAKFAYVYVDATDGLNPVYGICDQTKYLRQYFKFIRPGALRVEATTTNNSIDPVAFINSTGNQVVVIKAEQGDSIHVHGLNSDEYSIKYTLGNYSSGGVPPASYDIDLPSQTVGNGDILTFNMPGKGVATIYGLKKELSAIANPKQDDFEVTFYPNPARDLLMIQNDRSDHILYQIRSLEGTIHLRGEVNGKCQKSIDISSLTPGTYLIHGDFETQKLIVH
jgi:hypothetical protein